MSPHSTSPATSRPPRRTLRASARRDGGGLAPAAVAGLAASILSALQVYAAL